MDEERMNYTECRADDSPQICNILLQEAEIIGNQNNR